MTVAAQTLEVIAAGDGSDQTFSFSFKVFANTDLKVYKRLISTGVDTLMTLGVDYTVALNTSTDGGVVTYTVAPTLLQQSRIVCDVPAVQSASLRTNGKFSDDQLEAVLDKLTILIQQLEADNVALAARVAALEA